MRTPLLLVGATCALTLTASLAAHAASAKDARPAAAEEKPPTMGKDKPEIEAYLKQRLATIRAANKAQLEFEAEESRLWQEHWNKVKDDRELFEVRVAKQRLNVFESLDSLEKAEHGKTIADYERMQDNVLSSFEAAQRAKMTAFFAAQTARLKAFAAKQEKDRAAFAADATGSWRRLKAVLAPSPPKR